TTELAAIAARRATGPVPAPTLWLRGADLLADDTSVADAVARTLQQAGRIVGAAGAPGDMASATPERVARLAAGSGVPLLVLLDAPEEMPPVLAHRLADWTTGTARWLRENGVRLVVGCRPEHWETAGPLYPPGALHRPSRPARRLPPAVRVTDFTAGQAERAREGLGLPPDALAAGHDRHPLTLRLLAEVREALPPGTPGRPGTEEVFAAHLDLMCLRVAVRIAAGSRPGPTAVRRLAARVAGQVHEAARRCLGPGQGELDRAAFEELFPWRTGWAPAVLTEGLLVPAGAGYRFAHEEVGDWIQSAHLDLDAALRALVHRWHAEPAEDEGRVPRPRRGEPAEGPLPAGPRSLPVPRHRIGPVIQALLLLSRRQGTAALAHRLADLIEALDRLPETVDGDRALPLSDPRWWAAHLLAETLLRVPDARPYLGVLRLLAGRVVRSSAEAGGGGARGAHAEFGPWFWRELRLPEADRMDLFRRLVPADGPPGEGDGDARFLDAVARRLAAHPRTVQPLLCAWFTDERPLPAAGAEPPVDAEEGARERPTEATADRPTVAAAAQALLYAHRDLAADDLTDALADAGHLRAEELLAALAEDEPAALCRAVERWAGDEDRRARRVAAVSYATLVAPRLTLDADRDRVRRAVLAVLARPSDSELHG
ncbi:serine protease, partial [Streptomyces sp. SID9727]|nr:serine protease [Streptomyces sp. SID9727]